MADDGKPLCHKPGREYGGGRTKVFPDNMSGALEGGLLSKLRNYHVASFFFSLDPILKNTHVPMCVAFVSLASNNAFIDPKFSNFDPNASMHFSVSLEFR